MHAGVAGRGAGLGLDSNGLGHGLETGAPGEGQCIGCHTFAGFLNPGILAISRDPESYEPGQTYPIADHA